MFEKGTGKEAEDNRPITVLAIPLRAATKQQFQQTEEWRDTWMTDQMRGAQKYATCQDITWTMCLEAGTCDMEDTKNYEIFVDKMTFFDFIVREIVLDLEEDLDCAPMSQDLGKTTLPGDAEVPSIRKGGRTHV